MTFEGNNNVMKSVFIFINVQYIGPIIEMTLSDCSRSRKENTMCILSNDTYACFVYIFNRVAAFIVVSRKG